MSGAAQATPIPAPRVFLDACVLYPPLLRGLLTGAAQAGLIRPLWSARVLDEWIVAAGNKQGPLAAQEAQEAARALCADFAGALCPPDAAREAAIVLPDPADAHVLAAAAGAGATAIVTLNLRDFPARILAGYDLEAQHPDALLWKLWSDQPAAVEAVLAACLPGCDAAARHGPLRRARLNRLAKAQAGL